MALQIGLCKVWMGMLAWGLVAIACATANAVAEAMIPCVCNSALEEGIQLLELLHLFMLALEE